MRKKLFFTAIAPVVIIDTVSAQTTFKSLVNTFISSVFNSLIMLAVVVASAAFSFGIYKYVMGARSGDSNQIAKGNQFLLWGGIALFVMSSVWGFVTIGQKTFGFKPGITIPGMESFMRTAPDSSAIRIGSPSSFSPQSVQAAAAISQQAAAEGKPLPQSYDSCLTGGFLSSLCQSAFGSASGQTPSSAFNNGCDPQDASCSPSPSGAYNYGCDPQDPSCGPNTSSASSGAYNYGCDPQDPSCTSPETDNTNSTGSQLDPYWNLDAVPTGDTWSDRNTEPASSWEDSSTQG